MPWLLCRYILGDLVRSILLTTLVLVFVIAFGATIKPISSGLLLTASQTARYLVLVTVPMLEFALPFASGFAVTLSMHRFATENEILAASVSGVPYRKILLPVFLAGAILSTAMVGLTQWVVPTFWGLMEQTIARDITLAFQASLDRGRPFEIGNIQIYADENDVINNPQETTADTRLRLYGVVAAELDDTGRVATDVTAEQAVIDIYRRRDGTVLKLVLYDAVALNEAEGALFYAETIAPDPLRLPRVFRDQPRSMTRAQLLDLRANPDTFGPIRDRKATLARYLQDADDRLWVSSRLEAEGRVEFIEAGTNPRRYVVRADQVRGGILVRSDGQPVEIAQWEAGRALRRFEAASVNLQRTRSLGSDLGFFEVTMNDVTVFDLTLGGEPNVRSELVLPALTLTGLPERDYTELSSDELLARAEALPTMSKALQKQIDGLRDQHDDLQYEISARLVKRYATSCTAVLLVSLGAVLAIWLRRAMPLTIYILSFAPAVLTLILISGGGQVARDGDPGIGFIIMWSGDALLLLMLLVASWKLRQH